MGSRLTQVAVLAIFLTLAGLMSGYLRVLNHATQQGVGSTNTVIYTADNTAGTELTIKGSSVPAYLRVVEELGGVKLSLEGEQWDVRTFLDSEEYEEFVAGLRLNEDYSVNIENSVLTIS